MPPSCVAGAALDLMLISSHCPCSMLVHSGLQCCVDAPGLRGIIDSQACSRAIGPQLCSVPMVIFAPGLAECALASTTQHNTTQHNTTQHNTTQHNTTQHNTTQHNTTQHNTTQHNTTQHNTTQHNTTQHNTQKQVWLSTCEQTRLKTKLA